MFYEALALLRNDDGATMVEYGIMVALIAAICIAIVTLVGKSVQTTFSTVNSGL